MAATANASWDLRNRMTFFSFRSESHRCYDMAWLTTDLRLAGRSASTPRVGRPCWLAHAVSWGWFLSSSRPAWSRQGHGAQTRRV